ncbi:MAG: peptidylprolyl isomerase, partial [Patescibacteria group bacterium]
GIFKCARDHIYGKYWAPPQRRIPVFINLTDNTGLDFDKPPEVSQHPVFGKVVSGMDIVDKIAKVEVDQTGIPVSAVTIKSVVIQ